MIYEDPPPEAVCLLLPGMTLNGSMFPDLGIPSIEADFTRLVMSENGDFQPLPAGRGGMDIYVERLNDLVAGPDWRDVERRVAVAHSFGGMLALQWLLSGSNQVGLDGLVLVATTPGPMFDAVRMKIGRVGSREFRLRISGLIRWWNRPLVTKSVKRLMNRGRLDVQRVDFRALKNPTPLTADLAGWRNTDWRAMRSFRIAMEGWCVADQLEKLSTRTIILHGTNDGLFPLTEAEKLVRGLPNAELRVIDGATHILPITHGEVVKEAVENLLARC